MMSYRLPLVEQQASIREGDLDETDLEALLGCDRTAWDIETSGLDFRSDRIGTVQVADETGRTWVVKIRPDIRPEALLTLLARNTQRKVFHFAPFDLGFMRYTWGIRAQNVACTKVLHRLVEPSAASHSLQQVLLSELQVEIEKNASVRRSDWSAETLSGAQLRYAAQDVVHLLPLFDHLMERATRQGVSRLAQQSFDYLPVRVETEMLGLQDLFAY